MRLLVIIFSLLLQSVLFAQADDKQVSELKDKAAKAYHKNRYEDAVVCYLQLLQIYTTANNVEEISITRGQLASCYDLIGDKARDNKNYFMQIEYYKKAIAIDTASGYNFIKEDLKAAIATHIPPILEEAAGLVKNKKYKEATDLYSKILEADPANQEARQGLNNILLVQTDTKGGIALMNKKIKTDSSDYYAYTSLEKILKQKKDTAALSNLLHIMARKVNANDLIHVYDDLQDFYTHWVKDEPTAQAWYGLKLNLYSDKMKMEEYEKKNREQGFNTNVDTIISIYRRIWNTKDDQYQPTGANYAFTFLLNPYNKLTTSGGDLRKAENILDHDININYKEIIRDKDIIYPQSDYKYGNRAEKEENQKALLCRMLEAKAGIQYLAGDIEQAKETLEKEDEVIKLMRDKFPKERQVYFVNMIALSNGLKNPDAAKLYFDQFKQLVPAHFDPAGNLCLRFMHGNEEYYFQMKIAGDKQAVISDYHSAKQIDEEITAESEELLMQRIRDEEKRVRDEYRQQFNEKIKGKKKYVFIRFAKFNTFTYRADSSAIAELGILPYIVYADKYMGFDRVMEKFYAIYGKDVNDNFKKSKGIWHDCDTEDCDAMDNWIYDKEENITEEYHPTIYVTLNVFLE